MHLLGFILILMLIFWMAGKVGETRADQELYRWEKQQRSQRRRNRPPILNRLFGIKVNPHNL